MRRHIVPVVLAIAGTALAQNNEAPEAAEADAPEGSVTAAPPGDETGVPQGGGIPGELDGDGVYTVKGGDTLWDLSQAFLSNPWYWPKIWADNPAVENPHWIYPGNRLKIRNGGDGLPAEIVQADGPVEEPLPKAPELADFSTGTLDRADALGQSTDLVSIAGKGRIGLAPPDELRVRVASIVTPRELAEAGVVDSSFEQKELLSTYDRAYFKFKGAQPKIGDQFSIFRTRSEVIHPVTKATYGYQTEILGSATIVAVERGMAIGEIGQVTEYVTRGDRLGPPASLQKVVRPKAAGKDVAAVILATLIPKQTEIGEHHIVFLDKGSKHGVEEGNTFTVIHAGDGLDRLRLANTTEVGQISGNGPREPVATAVVFDVRDDTAAAMVVKSVREVRVGDLAETRGGGRAGGAGGDAP